MTLGCRLDNGTTAQSHNYADDTNLLVSEEPSESSESIAKDAHISSVNLLHIFFSLTSFLASLI